MKKLNKVTKVLIVTGFITVLLTHIVQATSPEECQTKAVEVEEPQTKTLLENCKEAVTILDSLVEKRPAILHLIRMTAHRAGKVLAILEARDADQADEVAFLAKQKGFLMAPVSKFLGLVHENGSMVIPIVEELLGQPSVYFPEFFGVDKEQADAHFEQAIDSIEHLNALAQEVRVVCTGLDSEEIFERGYPKYREYLAELKKQRAGK